MAETPDRAMEILADLLETPETGRDALLDRACAGEPGLRAEVERLLGLGENASHFLERLELTQEELLAAQSDAEQCEKGTLRFGRYRALRLIAEGGMGSVYEAQQDQSRRHVAVKVIKLGMDTRQVIARFEVEREALALMDHPNIAAVLDAGVSDRGRPFFAMELIKGERITRYCDENRLSVPQRVELFVQVCRAVQHAHQKGIIHRDLKPSNVLVSAADGKPSPKIIDFGISKALHQKLTERTLVTEFRQLMGTPEYMPPEQADMSGADVDTRCDIYSLGVLLYELLSGTTPFEAKELRNKPYNDIQRMIREVEPPAPSARISELGESAAAVAANRSTDPPRLAKLVRGELDWIVMKCLEKDRTRRYETAHELAADVERHVRHEPVQAGPPTSVYRLRKFVRRNRVPMGVMGLIAMLLVAGITGTTLGMLRARASRTEALAGQKRAEELLRRVGQAEMQARHEAQQAARLNEFLLEMFRSARPGMEGGGRDVKVADLLDYAAAKLPEKFKGQPEAQIHVRATLAGTYGHLGLLEKCVEQFMIAYESACKEFGDDSPLALSLGAKAAGWMGQNTPTPEQLDKAQALGLKVFETAQATYGEAHPLTHSAAHAIGWALVQKGESVQAERVYRRMLQVQEENPGAYRDLGAGVAHHGLAWALRQQKKLDEAEEHQREAVRLNSINPDGYFPREHIATRRIMGLILADQGKLEEAAETFRDALRAEKDLGHNAPPVERASREYMNVLARMKDFALAEDFARHRLGSALADTPVDQTLVVERMEDLIRLLQDAGKPQEANKLESEHIQALQLLVGQPANTVDTLVRRALCNFQLGRFKDAAGDYARCIKLDPTQFDLWFRRGCLLAYAEDKDAYEAHCRQMLQRFGQTTNRVMADRAAKVFFLVPRTQEERESIAQLVDRALGNGEPDVNDSWYWMLKGLAEYRAGRFASAVEWLNKSLATPPDTKFGQATAELILAMAHFRLGHVDQARALFDSARQKIDPKQPMPNVGSPIPRWLICRVTLRESEKLLQAVPPSPRKEQ